LRAFVHEWSERHGIPAELEASPAGPLPAPVSEAQLRAAQEALTNVARHAGAGAVRVSLAGNDAGMELRVADEGKGFDPGRPGGGEGLAIMAERARAVGATVEVGSRPGAGTEVVARWSALRSPPARP
jgi:signal transduction histidine kinase